MYQSIESVYSVQCTLVYTDPFLFISYLIKLGVKDRWNIVFIFHIFVCIFLQLIVINDRNPTISLSYNLPGCLILILIHYIEVYLPESTSFQDVQSRKFEAENHLDPEIQELMFY